MKRASIFIISGILVFNSVGIDMVYFITFADTTSSIVQDLFHIDEASDGFAKYVAGRTFWVLVLGALILPICLKKELQELHIVSVSLFVALILFILLLFLQLCIFGPKKFTLVNGVDFSYSFAEM